MFRRPSKDPTTRRSQSYTDVDLENNSGHSSSHEYNINSTSVSFRLMSLLKKQWQNFSDTNFAICQESTDFVVAHKPEFDKEKLKLIRLGSFLETDVLCGTVTAIKTRRIYDGPKLNERTFSPEWNQDAHNINELIITLNREINRENMLMQGSDFTVEPKTKISPPSSSHTAPRGSYMSQFTTSSDEMTQMKVMTQEAYDTFKQNPQQFFRSPKHTAVACLIVFAAIGLCSTVGLILF